MIFTKLLPVAVVESALAFCFNIFPYKFSAPFSRFFFSPVPRSAWYPRRFSVLRSIRPFPQPWSLVPAYHKGNDSEDEYCLKNLLKTFVTRINLAEQRRTLSSTYQQLSYLAGISVKTNPNHCLII